MSVAYQSNLKSVVDAVGRKEQSLLDSLQKGMNQGVEDFRKMMTQTELTGRPGLNVRTGNLKNNFVRDQQGEGWNFRARVYFRNVAWYAKVHQHADGFSGTIRSKSGKMLAIPLNSSAAKIWPRDRTDLSFAVGKKGPLLYKTRTTKGGKLRFKPEYALKQSVFIPKRLHILEYWCEFGAQMIGKRMMEFVKRNAGHPTTTGYAIWGNQ